MLNIDAKSLAALERLRQELAWLEANHPEKTALINLALSHLRTIEAASGSRHGLVGDGPHGFYPSGPWSFVTKPSNPDEIERQIYMEDAK
jgi:hypothetical protein